MKVNEAQNRISGTELSPRPAQHTAGPWYLSQDGVTIYGALNPKTGAYPLIGKAENPVSISSGVKEEAAGRQEQVANAELIVKAVNSHEALVSAAARALAFLEGRTTKLGGERSLLTIELRDVLDSVRGATVSE